MERFENIPEQLATVRRFELAGFPAAELRDKNQPFACLVGIDVADGQHLGDEQDVGVEVRRDGEPLRLTTGLSLAPRDGASEPDDSPPQASTAAPLRGAEEFDDELPPF